MAAEIGHRMHHDALAGLASVALAASDVKGAMALAERLLTVLAPSEQDGADSKPILLTCHQVLRAESEVQPAQGRTAYLGVVLAVPDGGYG